MIHNILYFYIILCLAIFIFNLGYISKRLFKRYLTDKKEVGSAQKEKGVGDEK